jgi:hypothetical protein
MAREFEIDKINLKQPSLEQKLTGEYLGSLPPTAAIEPNSELEDGEYLMFPDGAVQESVGQKHSKAGIKLNLPKGTQILSNYLKLDKKEAKVIQESLGVKVKPGETYASALKKYTNTIGLTKLNDEQEEVFEELRKLLEKKPDGTQTMNVNREYLSAKIKEIEDKKSDLYEKRKEAFSLMFQIQEAGKKPEVSEEDTFKYGGISKARFSSLLDKYGLTEEQGLEMLKYGGIKKYQKGDTVGDAYTYLRELEGYDPKSERGVAAVQSFINGWQDRPGYEYKPVSQEMKDRLKGFVKMWDLKGYSDEEIDKADQTTLNKIAGELQSKVIKDAPELAYDYGAVAPPTKQGLEWLDKNGAISPKTHPQFYKDGKIVSGLGEKIKNDPGLVRVYKDVVGSLPEDKKKAYAESNYKDNQWYFRSIGTKTVEFTDPEEFEKFKKENKDKKVEGSNFFRVDNKEGAYIRPILLKEQEFASKEEAEKFAKGRKAFYGDFYLSDEPDVAIRPKFKGQPEEVKPPPTAPNEPGKIEDLGKQPANKYPRMFYRPDQRTLPPTAMLPHLKIDTKLGRIDPIRMGIEQQLQNISDSRVFAADKLDDLPPSQRAAALASITASGQMAENQATFQTNQWNAQNLAQTELFNVGKRDREAMANAQNALDYERRAYTARDVFDNRLRGFFDYNRRVALSDYDYNRKMNLASSIFPDYSPNFYGNMIEFDPDSEVTLEDRRALIGTYGNMSV